MPCQFAQLIIVVSHLLTLSHQLCIMRAKILIFILERFSLKNHNDAKVKSIKESVPHIEETLQVYSARVDTLWNQICSEKSLGAIGSENVPLSKQLYQLLGPLIMVR